jgi:hypothetical protein
MGCALKTRYDKYDVTYHAMQRWQQRVDPLASLRQAKRAITKCAQGAVRINARLAREHWGRKPYDELARKTTSWHRNIEYLFSPSAVLVCHRDVILTVLEVTLEDVAAMLVLMTMQTWTGREDREVAGYGTVRGSDG